jgi:hypothetical protein
VPPWGSLASCAPQKLYAAPGDMVMALIIWVDNRALVSVYDPSFDRNLLFLHDIEPRPAGRGRKQGYPAALHPQ